MRTRWLRYRSHQKGETMEQENRKSLVEEILELWISITGMDPESNQIHFRYGDDFSIDSVREDLKEAIALDDTGLTALLMLRVFAEEFFKYKTFSMKTLMDDTGSIPQLVEKGKLLQNLLYHEEIVDALETFQDKLKQVLDKMEAEEKTYKALEDSGFVGYLRRDAFRSMETLHCYQFSQGKTTSQNLQPVKKIFLFWDMASVIRLGLTMPDCTFLGLVRDKNEYASFFVLVAKNGENLTVYTDCPEWEHPLQKNMSRRPGKELSSRIAKHHFPYHLMDMEFDYRGDVFFRQKESTGLRVIQNRLEVIGSITALDPDETLWLIMVLAQMDAQLYKQNYHLPELSYSTEVLFENSLLAGVSQALCLRQDGTKFELPVNTVESLASDPQFDKSDEGMSTVFGTVNYHVNSWLEERYKDQVPKLAINGLLLSDSQQLALNESADKKVSAYEKADIEAMGYFEKKDFLASHSKLETLSGNEFGSIEMLEKNYRFLARYNEAVVINQLAAKDYEAHNKEVSAWFRSRILANMEQLVSDLVESWPRHQEDKAVQQRWAVWPYSHAKDGKFPYRLRWFYQEDNSSWSKTKCILTGKPVSYAAALYLRSIEDLMYATACSSVEELPEWLRHWKKDRFYSGNPILQRIDPMTWVVKDKWAEMSFDCLLFLSKTAINAECKKKGISPSLFVPYQETD